jgi:ectoine hydroxylase-related dioxygenase (phytanoyl-CoA dioxygenase family)
MPRLWRRPRSGLLYDQWQLRVSAFLHTRFVQLSGRRGGAVRPSAIAPDLRPSPWHTRAVDLEAHATEIRDQGYTILEGVIEVELIDAIAAALDRLEVSLGIVPADNLFEGHQTVRIYNLLARGEIFQRIPVHPAVLPLVERVLDSGCLVSSLSSIAICPGEIPQPLHADDQLIPLPKPHVPIVCNTMWAITDFTEENGATRVAPGTHRRPDNPVYGEPVETIPAEMPRGSVLVYNGSLWHGGGENRGTARRIGVAMNYCAGYIRQQENQQLGLPTELVSGFPRRLQELVGYGVYAGLIGHIEKRSPRRLLGTIEAEPRVFDWAKDPTPRD